MNERGRFTEPGPPGSALGRLVLAAVAVDRNELEQAQFLLDAAAEARLTVRDPVTAAGRAIATARLLLARGNARAALEAAEPAVSADVVSPWAQAQTVLVVSTAHLAVGRPEVAAGLWRTVPDDQVACAVGAARAHLAAGHPAAAIDLLDRVNAEGRTGPAVTVRAALVRAQAADAAGDSATARRLVAHALREARRERLRRPFLEAGPWLRPHLGTVALRGLAAGWLTPGPPHAGEARWSEAGPPAPVVEALSGRELDVLRRLARTMSTEEIAADLFVSVNTVKTHLKSVYRKLAVNRRNEAVRRARELRLL
jgi:LuxR family maltose regulon positive regulatory protein